MRWVFTLVLCYLAGSSISLPADAQSQPAPEKRIALIIGSGAYQNAPQLPNPPGDAHLMAEALRKLNFEVDEVIDPTISVFTRKLREFDYKAQQADAALIFYAGHGVQVDRVNYLVPVDATLSRERDLVYEAIPLDLVLGAVSQAKKVGIVLLDACRNNPFTDKLTRSLVATSRDARSTSVGLARVDNVPRNTVVAMSTRANETSEDGAGTNSPFTNAVVANLRIPGLELSLFFRSVRDTVLRATNNRQEPYVFSSLGAEPFYFNPRPPNRPPVIGATSPLTVTDASGPTPLGIPRPTDADDDPLTVHVIGLPRNGEIRVNNSTKVVAINDTLTLDVFMQATFKPDGKVDGPVGTFDYLVDDGRGGTVLGVLPIIVTTVNRPPVVEGERTVRVYPGYLGISKPSDPDGDALTVTITSLPTRGLIRNGTATLKVGDKVKPEQLGLLSYWTDPGSAGDMGAVTYTVDDGRGGKAIGKINLQVAAIDDHPATSDGDIWRRIAGKGNLEEINAFLRLFPDSVYTDEAKQQQRDLRQQQQIAKAGQSAPPAPTPPPAPQAPPAAPSAPGKVASLAPVPTPAPPPPPPPSVIATLAPPNLPRGNPNAPPSTFTDCSGCPPMVNIPAGTFQMGSNADPSMQPVRHVAIAAMAMGQHPVTLAEWRVCMTDNGCTFLPKMVNPTDKTPIYNVSWDDAKQYTTWLSNKTGRRYRLPSEAEWEYAARANTTTAYWWGNEVGISLANCADCGPQQDKTTPMPVESFKPNPFGLYDMAGGVAQWVEDCWFPTYKDAPVNGVSRDLKACTAHALRGGSFRTTHDTITVAARSHYDAFVRYITNGFRVAADPK